MGVFSLVLGQGTKEGALEGALEPSRNRAQESSASECASEGAWCDLESNSRSENTVSFDAGVEGGLDGLSEQSCACHSSDRIVSFCALQFRCRLLMSQTALCSRMGNHRQKPTPTRQAALQRALNACPTCPTNAPRVREYLPTLPESLAKLASLAGDFPVRPDARAIAR